MISGLADLLDAARRGGYAVGGFNVYDLAGVKAVVAAAEAERAPAIIQLHQAALEFGGGPLIALGLAAAVSARVPVCVHMDHARTLGAVRQAVETGMSSVMADGAHLPFEANVAFVAEAVQLAKPSGVAVEAELGLLSGSEDGLTVEAREARLTDPGQAQEFVKRTGVDALAVCIGNVHGIYRDEPRLDFERLAAVQSAALVPLVLHGASGLPPALVQRAVKLGVCKFNVNTELREAYVAAVRLQAQSGETELLGFLGAATAAMADVVREKLNIFGSAGRASAEFETRQIGPRRPPGVKHFR